MGDQQDLWVPPPTKNRKARPRVIFPGPGRVGSEPLERRRFTFIDGDSTKRKERTECTM